MTKREARRDARDIAAAMIFTYQDAGQPNADCYDNWRQKTPLAGHRRTDSDTCPDCDEIVKQLEKLRLSLTPIRMHGIPRT